MTHRVDCNVVTPAETVMLSKIFDWHKTREHSVSDTIYIITILHHCFRLFRI